MGQNLNNGTFPAHDVHWYRRRTASWGKFKIKEVSSSLKDKVEVWEEEGEGGIWEETKTPATQGKGDWVWVWGRRREKGRSPPIFFWIITTSTFNLTDSFVSPVLDHPVQMDLLSNFGSHQTSKFVTASCFKNLPWHHMEVDFAHTAKKPRRSSRSVENSFNTKASSSFETLGKFQRAFQGVGWQLSYKWLRSSILDAHKAAVFDPTYSCSQSNLRASKKSRQCPGFESFSPILCKEAIQ